MFGIGLPEMLVILAVGLIVVGPDKLPDLARSLAKGMVELKRTMNQVKHSLIEENDILNEVQSELKKTAGEFQEHLLEGPQAPADQKNETIDLKADEERPWEADRLKTPPQHLSGPTGTNQEATDSRTDQEQQEGGVSGDPPVQAS